MPVLLSPQHLTAGTLSIFTLCPTTSAFTPDLRGPPLGGEIKALSQAPHSGNRQEGAS